MNQFLRGTLAMACIVAAMFFFRYFRLTRDRLFLIFCLAFAVLALNWTALAVLAAPENRAYFYLLRLVAFGMIAAAVIDKNRRPR